MFKLTAGADYLISRSYLKDKIYFHLVLLKKESLKNGYILLKSDQINSLNGYEISFRTSPDSSDIPLISQRSSNELGFFEDGSNYVLTELFDYSKIYTIGILTNYENFNFDDLGLYVLNSNIEDTIVVQNLQGGPVIPPTGYEICGNGKDDDNDGKIDCDDEDCFPPNFVNIVQVNPTCPICADGKIVVTSNKAGLISIDGGLTWQSTTGYIVFAHLNPGTYNIVLKRNTEGAGCGINTTIIVLEAPPGKQEFCDNGGFEYGNFDNWEGGTGTCYNQVPGGTMTTLVIDNNNLAVNTLHNIILADPNAFDPNTGTNIPLASPYGGTYLMRLGDLDAGEPSAENIKYKFIVDNTNKNFKFYYAFVGQAPHEPITMNGRFQIVIRNLTTKQEIYNSGEIYADTRNSYFLNYKDLIYKGWTCFVKDLSGFIGNQIEVEFIVGDCILGKHFAYAYIDGLCSEIKPIEIQCEPMTNVFCQGQDPVVNITGTGYNRYQWTVSKIKDGIEYDQRVLDMTVG